jgi:hypothetical protein
MLFRDELFALGASTDWYLLMVVPQGRGQRPVQLRLLLLLCVAL